MTISSARPVDAAGTPATGAPAGTNGTGFVRREARRVPIFDGLRGVCAVGLLVVHVAWTARLVGSYTDPPTNRAGAVIISGFQILVGVFFLISGMFLFRPFARSTIAGTPRPELRPYFIRRALRLLPAYYLVAISSLLLLNFYSINSLWYVVRPLTLMQNYDPTWMAGMDVTWTVPTEVQWYLVLPLMFWAVRWYARRGADPVARARRLLILVPILIAVGFGWIAYVHQPSMGIFPTQFWWPVGVAANFGIGIAFGVMSALSQVAPDKTPALFRSAARHPNLYWLAALLVFAVNCAHPFGRAGYGDYDTMTGGLVFYVVFLFFCSLVVLPMIAPGAKSRLINAVLGNRVIVYLGRISYGIYLWHFFVMNVYFRNGSLFGADPLQVPALRGKAGFWQLESAVLLGTIVIASVSYFLVERPLMERGERWIQARRRRSAALVEPVMTPLPVTDKAPV